MSILNIDSTLSLISTVFVWITENYIKWDEHYKYLRFLISVKTWGQIFTIKPFRILQNKMSFEEKNRFYITWGLHTHHKTHLCLHSLFKLENFKQLIHHSSEPKHIYNEHKHTYIIYIYWHQCIINIIVPSKALVERFVLNFSLEFFEYRY